MPDEEELEKKYSEVLIQMDLPPDAGGQVELRGDGELLAEVAQAQLAVVVRPPRPEGSRHLGAGVFSGRVASA